MAKAKCKCPKPGLTAPFYMLTYGDMMTLLLTFFVLLFSMSTIQITKFEAQISIMQGSLGISNMYQHVPMQEHLPAPSVKQQIKKVSRTEVKQEDQTPAAEISRVQDQNTSRQGEEDNIQQIRALGTESKLMVHQNMDEIVIILPTYGIFRKGDWEVDPDSPEVRTLARLYQKLAQQVANLTEYDIIFVGHTDSIPVLPKHLNQLPRNNMELGFLRAVSIYDYFFSEDLTDRTRVSFASQGDNVPLVPSAKLDSERRKNRRVEIHLRKRDPDRQG